MKPFDHFIPSLLLLMAVAFGAPQSSDHNLLLNETVDASYSRIGIYDLVLNYTDLMSDPEPGDRFANVSAPISAFTGLSTVPITGSHGVIIRMGTSKQHIGELNKQRMWDTIHNSLMQLCPIERGQIGCYKDMPGARNPESFYPPNPEYLTYYKRISIGGIPYKDDKGNYATNARLIITMEGMFRERNFPGLAAATYEIIAGVFKMATETQQNCYKEQFNDLSRPYVFCNVPDRVMVVLPAHRGQIIQSWVSLKLAFNGQTTYGEFDCYKTMTPVIRFWEANVLPDVAKVMGTVPDDWRTPCTQCFKETEAFDVHTWRDYKSDTCSYLGYAPN